MREGIHTISFVGLGLIGASLMQALKRAAAAIGRTIEMIGFDPGFSEADVSAITGGRLCLDRFERDPERLYRADLVVLCAPVRTNIALLETVRQYAPADALVMDVSSTKAEIARRAQELALNFIGLHPIAGREQQGYRAASPELLCERTVIICSGEVLPNSGHAAELVELLEAASCRVAAMTPEKHDRIYANISHLPQLVSTALMQHCRDNVGHSGPGFISTTRLAGSPWGVWRDIVQTNRQNIASELEAFSALLADLAKEVRSDKTEELDARFSEANRLYQRLQERGCS
ncbi:MAG TPA: prephenate dehydrogenase [Chlorobaculum parvum]|uniref:Prephenate dehydrogenase n=1 Tax=Chlorobaculum parvum TaxID=274539 RepID=A0A7C5DDP8_9CHLB|nr:prephenate dehydrogenase [Chlorobaculum parvum]